MAAPCHSGTLEMAFKLFGRQSLSGWRNCNLTDSKKRTWVSESRSISNTPGNPSKQKVSWNLPHTDRLSNQSHSHSSRSCLFVSSAGLAVTSKARSRFSSRSRCRSSRFVSTKIPSVLRASNAEKLNWPAQFSSIRSCNNGNEGFHTRNLDPVHQNQYLHDCQGTIQQSKIVLTAGSGSVYNDYDSVPAIKQQSIFPMARSGSICRYRPSCRSRSNVPPFLNLHDPLFSLSTFAIRTYVTGRSSASHYYDILGLTPKATQKQIKSAYYKMSKMHHPDVAKGKKSHTMFTEINEAYEVLGNIQKRRLYDRGLLHERDPRAPYNPDDMDFPGSRTRQSPFERGERPPPPRGRTRVYNFDEFYKQHYNEVRERRNREWNEYVKQQDMQHKDRHFFATQTISFPLTMLLWMMFVLFLFFESNRSKKQGSTMNRRGEMYDSLSYPPNGRHKEE